MTIFNIKKTPEQCATKLVNKWQYISDKLHEDLFIRVIIQNVGNGTQKTVQASFNSLFLGGIDRLMPLMNESFPELGFQAENCTKMNWIQSILFLNGFQTSDPLEVLLYRKTIYKDFLKAKSNFVREPILDIVLEGMWEWFLKEERVFMIMDPYGGRMNEISEFDIPFPHRKGNSYNKQYLFWWDVNGIKASNKHIHWIRMLYEYMRPYVSNFPRLPILTIGILI